MQQLTARILTAAATVMFLASAVLSPAPAAGSVLLQPIEDTMVTHVTVPAFDGAWFALMLPKTIGEQDMSMVNAGSIRVNWEALDEGAWRCRFSPGVLIDYTIELRPADNGVNITASVSNRTAETWKDVWMFSLLSPHGAPEFSAEAGGRRYIEVDGILTEAGEIDRSDLRYPYMVLVLAEDREPETAPHFVREFRQTADGRATAPWMAAVNAEGDRWFGVVAPEPVFVFTNDQIASLHVAPSFGDIPPGETRTVHMTALFGAGSLETAVEALEAEHLRLTEEGGGS